MPSLETRLDLSDGSLEESFNRGGPKRHHGDAYRLTVCATQVINNRGSTQKENSRHYRVADGIWRIVCMLK